MTFTDAAAQSQDDRAAPGATWSTGSASANCGCTWAGRTSSSATGARCSGRSGSRSRRAPPRSRWAGCTSALGSQKEADAFAWAVARGADVISCSWGPADGDWWDPSDPVHNEVTPLPDNTRLAIRHAVTAGRGGKGCVICWAAGNGNESADNDGYVTNPDIIAVAACNDRGKRSAYSDMGQAIWCAFPSDNGDPSRTPGIWTTDLSGSAGYNNGNIKKAMPRATTPAPLAAHRVRHREWPAWRR